MGGAPAQRRREGVLALGPDAEAFLRAAAAAGTTRLPTHLAGIVALEAAHGRDTLVPALRRAVQFHRFTVQDVRAILAAGPAAPSPQPAGTTLEGTLPAVRTRDLDAYRTDQLREVA